MKIEFLTNRLSQLLIISCCILFLSSCDNNYDPNNGQEDIEVDDDIVPLPQVYITTTNNQSIVDEPKINAKITISDNDIINYQGNIGIEIRGASSQMFPKKSYGFETRDKNNEDLDVALFDFPEEEDWILYAPYSDKSLLRNVLIYDLSREINRYASRTLLVELFVNDIYKGVYVFMEKLKRDSNRIDINKLKEDENSGEDLTGGYILKIDKTAGSNLGSGYNELNSFTTSHKPYTYFMYEYPKAKDITTEQKGYISEYITNFENVLSSDNFNDPINGYVEYIDVNSFIDFFLLNEISNNVDGFRLSTYMQKDKNEKLKMGPIWDFNLAFGNADYCDGGATDVWAYKFNERCPGDTWQVPFWWGRFLQDPAYISQLKSRWEELRGSTFSEAAMLSKIDTYTLELNNAKAIDRNFRKWKILGHYIWPNYYVGNNYEDENKYLKEWIENRLRWMDGAINDL